MEGKLVLEELRWIGFSIKFFIQIYYLPTRSNNWLDEKLWLFLGLSKLTKNW
jgi:hypothetical protein